MYVGWRIPTGSSDVSRSRSVLSPENTILRSPIRSSFPPSLRKLSWLRNPVLRLLLQVPPVIRTRITDTGPGPNLSRLIWSLGWGLGRDRPRETHLIFIGVWTSLVDKLEEDHRVEGRGYYHFYILSSVFQCHRNFYRTVFSDGRGLLCFGKRLYQQSVVNVSWGVNVWPLGSRQSVSIVVSLVLLPIPRTNVKKNSRTKWRTYFFGVGVEEVHLRRTCSRPTWGLNCNRGGLESRVSVVERKVSCEIQGRGQYSGSSLLVI